MTTSPFKREQIRAEGKLIDKKSDYSAAKQNQDLQQSDDEHNIRKKAYVHLACISVFWLFFTAVVIVLQGCDYCQFSLNDSVMMAFLTTSLATVLGLWGIGLGYYFFLKK